MSTSTSLALPSSVSPAPSAAAATAFEVLLVYAGILLYIWRWQHAHPLWWIPLLGAIFVSQLLHRDSLATLGLGLSQLRANAETILPLMLGATFLPLLAYGFASHRLAIQWPGKQSLVNFAGYGAWSLFQEYLIQSYVHNRLMSAVRNRHLSSLLVALMFSAAHIPNPVLMAATFVGGFLFSESFARHRNIWPLALAHTVGGFLIAAVSPPGLIHNMRVGPGYFFYGLNR